MKKINIALFFFLFCAYLSVAQNTLTPKIKIYFTQPVNTAMSTGVDAIYLHNCMLDTLIAYINRAKYTIDVAVYDYNSPNNIATAINNAFWRGVKIRWVYDGSSPNTAMATLATTIPRLGRPSGAGIMHNKFMIIDAGSSDANDPIVWTGSTNWETTMFNSDPNNVIIFQDQALAQHYTTEFNQMWGSTTMTPNASNAKFGSAKTSHTPHSFTIGGITVEQYFSPKDGTNSHILSTILSSTKDMYFGVYTFTESNAATDIKNRKTAGVYVAGIVDQFSKGSSAYSTLSSALGTKLKTYTQSSTIYHNKYVIVDPCETTSDPQVETGSHNWTSTADSQNDENIVIVHDATVANIYYQSFYQNFTDLGGTLTNLCEVGTGPDYTPASLVTYPNPCSDYFVIKSTGEANLNQMQVQLFDILGNEVLPQVTKTPDSFEINTKNLKEGIYLLKITSPSAVETKRIEVIR